MKHGILAQHIVSTADTPEQVYTFTGNAAYTLSFTNPLETSVEFSVAHVPAGESLDDKHWLVWKHDVQNWGSLAHKFLAGKDDQLYVRGSHAGTVLHLHGVAL